MIDIFDKIFSMNIPSFVGAETVINYNQILFKVVQKSKEVFT